MNGSNHAHDSRLRLWLKRLEIDRAVSFALAARIWQLLASPITAVLVAWYFSEEVLGYYFTFWSLIGLQTFAELGFQQVIIHIASHEWSKLHLDSPGSVQGDENSLSRLASLQKLALTWYSSAAIVFVPAVSLIGAVFFAQKTTTISWLPPWVALVLLTGISLCITALIALLEGCNQVATVQRYRLFQAISGNLVVWTLILSGVELWVAVAASGVQLLWELYLVTVVYRQFWKSLRTAKMHDAAVMSWKRDVWPLQWRIALQSILHYFAYQLFVPVMFHYHSAEEAGRMGMTWTVLNACQSVAFIWVQMRLPQFGMLVARREFADLDRLFWRVSLVSLAVLFAGAIPFYGGVVLLNHIPSRIAQQFATRFLPPLPVLLLTVGVVLLHVPRCLSVYLRAHKQDPLVRVIVVGNIVMALAVFLLGSRYGALAAASGFVVVVAAIIVPPSVIVWNRCRRDWHQPV